MIRDAVMEGADGLADGDRNTHLQLPRLGIPKTQVCPASPPGWNQSTQKLKACPPSAPFARADGARKTALLATPLTARFCSAYCPGDAIRRAYDHSDAPPFVRLFNDSYTRIRVRLSRISV